MTDYRLKNALLKAMPEAELTRLSLYLDYMELRRGDVLHRPGAPVEHLYFIEHGLTSLIATAEPGNAMRIGAFGPEGVSDALMLTDIWSDSFQVSVSIPGDAYRIEIGALRTAMAGSAGLKTLLVRNAHFAVQRFAQLAACRRRHSALQQSAFWFLVHHDNAGSAPFVIDARELPAAQHFEASGYVRWQDDRIAVADRRGLEAACCGCYASLRRYHKGYLAASPQI